MSTEADRILNAKRSLLDLLGLREPPPADDTPLTALVPDSFGLVEIAFRLESELDVRLEQSDLGSARTFGDLARLVAQRRSSTSASVARKKTTET
jgi:acyl carrier protein